MRLAEHISWDWSPDVGHYVRRRAVRYANGASNEIVLKAALSGEVADVERLRALSERARQANAASNRGRRSP